MTLVVIMTKVFCLLQEEVQIRMQQLTFEESVQCLKCSGSIVTLQLFVNPDHPPSSLPFHYQVP